jgi:2-dehydro-3-deoxygluconokinase
MVELSRLRDGSLKVSYGGDTLNTAIYLSRLGVDVGYVTALGDDPYSDDMISKWRDEGVDTRFAIRAKGRMPGLYAIRTDERGDRSFQYWRDHSPVNDLFGLSEFSESSQAREHLRNIDFLFLSGITLSLFSEDDRVELFELLDVQRERGGKVVFDTNHRSSRWSSDDAARAVYREMLERVDLALPTLEDEMLLFSDEDAYACAARHHDAGVSEVAVKMGEGGCLVSCDGKGERNGGGERKGRGERDGRREREAVQIPLSERREAKDTTGAGDSFNAGYLAARLNGREPAEAVAIGQTIAAEVVMHHGAIIPREAMPEIAI